MNQLSKFQQLLKAIGEMRREQQELAEIARVGSEAWWKAEERRLDIRERHHADDLRDRYYERLEREERLDI